MADHSETPGVQNSSSCENATIHSLSSKGYMLHHLYPKVLILRSFIKAQVGEKPFLIWLNRGEILKSGPLGTLSSGRGKLNYCDPNTQNYLIERESQGSLYSINTRMTVSF